MDLRSPTRKFVNPIPRSKSEEKQSFLCILWRYQCRQCTSIPLIALHCCLQNCTSLEKCTKQEPTTSKGSFARKHFCLHPSLSQYHSIFLYFLHSLYLLSSCFCLFALCIFEKDSLPPISATAEYQNTAHHSPGSTEFHYA